MYFFSLYSISSFFFFFFFFNDTATTEIYTLSLHDALPISPPRANVLPILLANPMEGMLGPLAHGLGLGAGDTEAWFVICRAPPGAALLASPLGRPAAEARPWTEAELLECVL